eukprot:scaffold116_cov334-Pavlova_lutheri.AAC.5
MGCNHVVYGDRSSQKFKRRPRARGMQHSSWRILRISSTPSAGDGPKRRTRKSAPRDEGSSSPGDGSEGGADPDPSHALGDPNHIRMRRGFP